MTSQVFDKFGRPIKVEDHEVLPDGAVMRVSVNLMDGAPPPRAATFNPASHRPGTLPLADVKAVLADAEGKARLAHSIDQKCEAWRGKDAKPEAAPVDRTKAPDVAGAIARRNGRLQDAWKGAGQ